jgi:hypothetical protein
MLDREKISQNFQLSTITVALPGGNGRWKIDYFGPRWRRDRSIQPSLWINTWLWNFCGAVECAFQQFVHDEGRDTAVISVFF